MKKKKSIQLSNISNCWNNIRAFPFVSRSSNMAEWMRIGKWLRELYNRRGISCTFHTTDVDLRRHTRSQLHLFAPCNTLHFRESQRTLYLGLNIQRHIPYTTSIRLSFRKFCNLRRCNLKFAFELFRMVLIIVHHFVFSLN